MKIRRLVLIYFALLAGFSAFFVWGFRIDQKYELVERGIRVQGFVAKLDCGNHASIVYQFSAQGRDYQGFKKSAGHCPATLVGSPVDVYYLGEQPSVSIAEPPLERFHDAIRDTLMISFIGALVGLGGVLRTMEKGIGIRSGWNLPGRHAGRASSPGAGRVPRRKSGA